MHDPETCNMHCYIIISLCIHNKGKLIYLQHNSLTSILVYLCQAKHPACFSKLYIGQPASGQQSSCTVYMLHLNRHMNCN